MQQWYALYVFLYSHAFYDAPVMDTKHRFSISAMADNDKANKNSQYLLCDLSPLETHTFMVYSNWYIDR